MSIKAAILALSPDIYWPMDDASGLVANDASGHGRNGAIEPNTVLQAPGPEAGTFAFAVPSPPGGIISGFTNPYAGSVHLTMIGWFSIGVFVANHDTLLNVGAGGVRGEGVGYNSNLIELAYNGIGFVNTTAPSSAGRWHQLGFELNPGVVQTAWLDGVQVYTAAAGVPNAVLGGDSIYAQSVNPILMAHAAFFTGALTTAQQASVVAARVNPQESTLTGRTATDFDIAVLNDLLELIYAAVHQSFP